jgi:hypothetical protein
MEFLQVNWSGVACNDIAGAPPDNDATRCR